MVVSPLVSQSPTCASQCIWQNPPTLSPSLWDHVQWPTPAQHQVCRICTTGDPFRVLPTHSVFGSMRLFQPFSLPHRSIYGPWLRKERNVKENVPASRWCLKHLRLTSIHAEWPWNLSKTKSYQDGSSQSTFSYYLLGFLLPFCDLFSPSMAA